MCVRTDNSKFGLRYTKNLRTMGMRRSRGGEGGYELPLKIQILNPLRKVTEKRPRTPGKQEYLMDPPPRPLEKIPYPLRKGTCGKQFLSEVRMN